MTFPGLDAAATAIILLDSKRIILYANPSAENLFNTSSKTLLNQPINLFFKTPEIINEVISLATKNDCTFKSLDNTHNIYSVRSNDTEPLDLSSTATPTTIGGKPGFLLEFSTLNSQLQKIQKDEQMLNQNQRNHELIRNLAHEIKNPLGGLRGAAQLLASDPKTEKLKQFTDIIIYEADRLQNLLNRLLIPIRLPNIEKFNIHEIVRHVIHLAQAEYPNKITFHEKFDVSLPDLTGDKEQLIQAVLNIVRNASQAVMPDGQIMISTEIVRKVTILKKMCPLAIRLTILDNGPGIPEEIKSKIFFPLISGRPGGSGLGLFIAQKLINENRGNIVVNSDPGRTMFAIVLPVCS